MNFLSAALNTFTGNSIPYSVGQSIGTDGIWQINEATNKDSKKVTLFTYDLNPNKPKTVQPNLIQNGCRIHKMFSVLPGILKIDDFISNDQFIYVVTENVTKLVLGDSDVNELGVLGIYQILTALRLIHERGISHNGGYQNDLLNCIYINSFGEWKLSGFESSQENSHGKLDCKLAGEAIYKLFNPREPFNQSKAMNTSGSDALFGLPIGQLLTGKWSIEEFIAKGEQPGSFFDTQAIRCYRRFQEFHILDLLQRLELFKGIVLSKGGFDEKFLYNKVIPEMEKCATTIVSPPPQQQQQQPNTQALSQIIYMMFLIIKDKKESDQSIDIFKSCYFKSLMIADRTVRLLLLKLLDHLLPHFSNAEIQDKLYQPLTTGFGDTDLTMRTETLTCMGTIIDKITDRQLNNDLLRHLAKLQIDPNPLLRISVVETLVNISEQMHSNTRPGILITAFGKGLKDSDLRVRLKSVDAFIETLKYFDANQCCNKVIGSLSPALVDKSSRVRQEAKKAMDMCIQKIEKHVQTMDDSGEVVEMDSNGVVKIDLTDLGDNLLMDISDLGDINVNRAKTYSASSNTSKPKKTSTESKMTSSFKSLQIQEDEVDDGWGFNDEDFESAKVKPISLSGSKPKRTMTTTTSTVKKAPGITLGKKKTSTVSKLKVTAEIEDDDGWGDGW